MNYTEMCGERVSQYGFGAMRLPVVGGDDAVIDEAAADAMVNAAMAAGINYYDTAWGYHGGTSEAFMGRALAKFPRECYKLATKFPGYDVANFGHAQEIFEQQLKKCDVDFFDFYLAHNLCELNIEQYLDKRFGTIEYLMEQREAGRIRHLGFSAHGSADVYERFMKAYGREMEFVQLQLNYLDWRFQEGERKVQLAREYGLPVVVMEPLRGGRLVNLSGDELAELGAIRPDWTAADWAFHWLQGVDGVSVVLSGASTMEQLQQNIATFSTEERLSVQGNAAIDRIVQGMLQDKTLPCTACHYCVSHCPMGLDIPELLKLYNEHVFTGGGFIAPMALGALPEDKKPSACIGCGACEAVCPQQLKIADAMADFAEKLA